MPPSRKPTTGKNNIDPLKSSSFHEMRLIGITVNSCQARINRFIVSSWTGRDTRFFECSHLVKDLDRSLDQTDAEGCPCSFAESHLKLKQGLQLEIIQG